MSCQYPQNMVNQTPRYDNKVRRTVRPNQVISKKTGIIRRDKRKKVKYF